MALFQNDMNSVAIIGGGITGLTAAFRLREKGMAVTVYETSSRIGGVIQTVRRDGYLAECGPNTILETSPKIGALIRDVGISERLLYSNPSANKRFLVRGSKLVQVPDSPAAFFLTPLFSLAAKFRLLKEPFIRPAPEAKEESLSEFVRRRLGKDFLDYAINPFVAGVYAGDPARLSVKHAFPKLYALEQRHGSLLRGQLLGARERKRRAEVSKTSAAKLSFDEGLQVLIDALRARLGDALRLRSTVKQLRESAEGWIVTACAVGRLEQREHSAVLFAAPAYKLPQIRLETRHYLNTVPLGEIHYPPVASVVLGFRREEVAHPLDGFGVLIPEVERFNILGTIFSSSLFPYRAPAGHVTLTSYVGGMRAPELALRSADELVGLTVGDLRRLLGVRGEPAFQHTFVYPKAIPQYEVGFGRFKALMSEMETKAPGLFLAGHYRDGISLSDSIVAGHDVVERIESFLAARQTGYGLAAESVQPLMAA